LISTEAKSFFNFFLVRFDIRDIGFRVAGNTIKITELAICHTHIGGVYISVYLPGDFSIRLLNFPELIRYVHQPGDGRIFKKKNSFFDGKKFKVQSAL
jgi:hypothetical protein